MDKKTANIISIIMRNAHKKKYKCIVNGCEEESINSHLLQQNGILDNICVERHLYELKVIPVYKWGINNFIIDFKRVGIRNALSLKLYCDKHDSSIFHDIEKSCINYESYRSQLLFSVRTVNNEIRKKEIALDQHNRLKNARTLNFNTEYLNQSIYGTELGIKDLIDIRTKIENELSDPKGLFIFKTLSYPILPVYGSAIFSPLDDIIDPLQEDPYSNILIHLIPLETELKIIIGYEKSNSNDWIRQYYKEWSELDMKELEKKITNLLTNHMENWGISPDLYENFGGKKIDEIIKRTHSTVSDLNYNNDNFNIFD